MTDKIYDQFRQIVKQNSNFYYSDYKKAEERVAKSTAVYKGEPVDFLYQGLFFSESEYKRLKNLLEKINSILDKVIEEYRLNPEFRTYFGFSDLMEELILINPGYDSYFPMGRFDIFYNRNGQDKFCELNADGASAMNEVRVIQDVIYKSAVSKKLLAEYEIRGFELFYTWIDIILENYRQYNNGIDDMPNIAILDFEGEGTIHEFKEFQKRFIEEGYRTVICDPRELRYTDGILYYNDLEIKLIYRRATTIRLVEEADDINDFLTAYREGAVCVVGGLVSQVIHNKVLFAILHDDDRIPFLNQEEKEFIKNHIPYTEIVNFEDDKLINKIRKEKDKWILKPFDQYAGKGVYSGRDFNNSEWSKVLDRIKGSQYIVQEYITVPELEMVSVDDELRFEKFGYLLGLFTYNKELAGLYTRAGRKNIIGAITESFTVPNYIYKERGV